MQPYEMTVAQLKNAIKNKELSCVDAVNSYIDRINDKDALVNAYLTKCFDSALDNAKISDEKISKGEELNYLQGVPYSLKDNICTEGIATTCSSKLLDGFKPTYSAHVYV